MRKTGSDFTKKKKKMRIMEVRQTVTLSSLKVIRENQSLQMENPGQKQLL